MFIAVAVAGALLIVAIRLAMVEEVKEHKKLKVKKESEAEQNKDEVNYGSISNVIRYRYAEGQILHERGERISNVDFQDGKI